MPILLCKNLRFRIDFVYKYAYCIDSNINNELNSSKSMTRKMINLN